MPYLKEDAYASVIGRLEREQEDIRCALRANIRSFKKLTDEQTLLKRELGVLNDLIRSIRRNIPK